MKQVRTYRGFKIAKDHTNRFVVIEVSAHDGEDSIINDKIPTVALAMEWIDQTQFD